MKTFKAIVKSSREDKLVTQGEFNYEEEAILCAEGIHKAFIVPHNKEEARASYEDFRYIPNFLRIGVVNESK